MVFRAFITVGVIALSMTNSLRSEIELVRVKWAQGYCLKGCEEGLSMRLRTMPQIAESAVPPGASEAQIRWKPFAKFSYPILNTIIKGGGIHIDQVFVRVRGTIEQDSAHTYLVSLGDGTRFTLLSPIYVPPEQSQGVARNNVASYKLSPDLRDKFDLNARESRVVTVQGTLFDPWRYSELFLIVQSNSTPAPLTKPQKQF